MSSTTPADIVSTALNLIGDSDAECARRLGVTSVMVGKYRKAGHFPANMALRVSKLTAGRITEREILDASPKVYDSKAHKARTAEG